MGWIAVRHGSLPSLGPFCCQPTSFASPLTEQARGADHHDRVPFWLHVCFLPLQHHEILALAIKKTALSVNRSAGGVLVPFDGQESQVVRGSSEKQVSRGRCKPQKRSGEVTIGFSPWSFRAAANVQKYPGEFRVPHYDQLSNFKSGPRTVQAVQLHWASPPRVVGLLLISFF